MFTLLLCCCLNANSFFFVVVLESIRKHWNIGRSATSSEYILSNLHCSDAWQTLLNDLFNCCSHVSFSYFPVGYKKQTMMNENNGHLDMFTLKSAQQMKQKSRICGNTEHNKKKECKQQNMSFICLRAIFVISCDMVRLHTILRLCVS